jgi:hypothetical protein
MNILDFLVTIPGLEKAYLGFQPAKPDGCIALFEYPSAPPEHYFGGLDIVHSVQARARDVLQATAYARAEAVADILSRYSDGVISSVQSTPILDIGVDESGRHEYTVNFTIRRY